MPFSIAIEAGRAVGKRYNGKKREGVRYAPIVGCWHEEARDGLTRNEVSDVTGVKSSFFELVLLWKWRQIKGMILVLDQVLTILG